MGTAETPQSSAEIWEHRYRERDHIWSGRPNGALVAEAGGLTPTTALDLGCGEGGDAIWLAERGWIVTAVDFSASAVQRGEREAHSRGIAAERIHWVVGDMQAIPATLQADLVCLCFIHGNSPAEHAAVIDNAARHVAPGGQLVSVGHAGPVNGSDQPSVRYFPHPAAQRDIFATALPNWQVLVAEARAATGHNGHPPTRVVDDVVVRARRPLA